MVASEGRTGVAPLITVLSGTSLNLSLPCLKKEISIGRAPSSDLALPDEHMSACHARVFLEAGQWFLEDLGSRNGTFVDRGGERYAITARTVLGDGVEFLVGRTLLRFGWPQDNNHTPERYDLRVTVRGSLLEYHTASVGACGPSATTQFRWEDITEARARMYDIAKAAAQHGLSNDDKSYGARAEEIRELGKFLCHQLLPRTVQKHLRRMDARNLFVIHDPELIHVPWELLFLEDRPLCLRVGIGRQVLVRETASEISSLPQRTRTSLLIIANPTGELDEAQAHAESLYKRICQTHPGLDVAFLAGPTVEKLDLLARIEKARIVYFIGHAQYDEAAPEQSCWLLSKDRVSCADLRRLGTAPDFVFANGCETSRECAWSSGETSLSAPYGLAGAFILSRIQNYLGALWRIPAAPSTTFAATFFHHLLDGVSLGECVQRGRLEVLRSHGENEISWAAYTLYGDPSTKVTV